MDKNSSENVIKKLSELNTQTPNKDTSIVLNIVNDELKYCNKLFIPFLDQITELEKSIQFKLKLVQIKSDKSSGNNRYLATENILNNLQPKKKNFIASFFAPTINLPEEQATFCLNTILSHEVQKIIEKLSNYLDKNPKISIKSLFLFLSTTELSHKNIGEIFSSLISLDGKCFDRAISKIIKLNVEKLQKPNNTFDGGDENCLIKKINNIINKMSPPLQAIPSIQ